jgi:hypothetical protein
MRNDAAIIRTRLCIQPVRRSWRIPASMIGYPVAMLPTGQQPLVQLATASRALIIAQPSTFETSADDLLLLGHSSSTIG